MEDEPTTRQAEEILRTITGLSRRGREVVFQRLSEERIHDATDLSDRIGATEGGQPEVTQFFRSMHLGADFRGGCRDANVVPTLAEYVDFMHRSGKLYDHYKSIRSYYIQVDAILTALESAGE